MAGKETLERLKSRIGRSGASSKRLEHPDDFIEIHHELMKEYGWITLDEFKKLPMPTLWNLLECIKKQREKDAADASKMKSRGRR